MGALWKQRVTQKTLPQGKGEKMGWGILVGTVAKIDEKDEGNKVFLGENITVDSSSLGTEVTCLPR